MTPPTSHDADSAPGVGRQMTALLGILNKLGDYPMSLVCSEDGLLLATIGELARSENAAGVTSLCHDIMQRAVRDLEFTCVDEVTVTDVKLGRFVVRPLPRTRAPRLYLVVQVPRNKPWRRNTTLITRKLDQLVAPLVANDDLDAEPS